MFEALLALGGLIVGGLVAWVWAAARARAQCATQLTDAERRAGAAEGSAEVLRRQVDDSETRRQELQAALDEERQARTSADAQLAAAVENLRQQRQLLEDASRALTDTFKALSADALKGNNEAFLALARKSLEPVLTDARGDLARRQDAIDGLVRPLREALKQYEEHVRALEESRQKAYGSIEEQIKTLTDSQQRLQRETGNLVTALRNPQVRGRWGEISLKRVVELAGMSEHCDFDEQVSVSSEGGRLRPDMVVQLPAGREIVVDAKVALDAYLDALSAESEDERKRCLERHARQTRAHMMALAKKSYWEQFPRAPEMVVMFIPGESFFGAALDCDRTLIEDGMGKGVVLATPTTLIALLQAVAYGWRQEQITRNARQICELGGRIYDRLRTLSGHLDDIRKGLERANQAYNQAVGSMERRVFPAARRFRELGAASGEEIAHLDVVETAPRPLSEPLDAEDTPPPSGPEEPPQPQGDGA